MIVFPPYLVAVDVASQSNSPLPALRTNRKGKMFSERSLAKRFLMSLYRGKKILLTVSGLGVYFESQELKISVEVE